MSSWQRPSGNHPGCQRGGGSTGPRPRADCLGAAAAAAAAAPTEAFAPDTLPAEQPSRHAPTSVTTRSLPPCGSSTAMSRRAQNMCWWCCAFLLLASLSLSARAETPRAELGKRLRRFDAALGEGLELGSHTGHCIVPKRRTCPRCRHKRIRRRIAKITCHACVEKHEKESNLCQMPVCKQQCPCVSTFANNNARLQTAMSF